MSENMSCRGAKHRFLILMYLTCFVLSLTPTIVAPPEKGFFQGQPEMQQAMDNMVGHGVIMKKSMNLPSNGATDYSAILSSKIFSLLSEAEQMLGNLKASKEKQWMENVVRQMRSIAKTLEKKAESRKFAVPKTLNPVSGTPVPEGLPLQPTLPATSAVPEFSPFQKPSRMVSKFPVTSPELSQVLPVNDYPSERQVVTKPAVLPNKREESEEDELVRELESLHQEVAPQVPFQRSSVQEEAPRVTSPATHVTKKSRDEKMNDVEMKKALLKARLMEEITQLQHLGESIPREVIDALNGNNQKIAGPTYKQKSQAEENNLYENTPNGMVDKVALEMLDDFKNEDGDLSKTNLEYLNSEKSKPYQDGKHFQEIILNRTFQNAHLHMPVFPRQMGNPNFSSQNKGQIYQKGLQNAIQDLKKPNPFNFHGRYPTFGSIPNQQVGHIPDALKQRMLKPKHMEYNGYPTAPVYNEYLARNGYGPYPYMHQWDHKNSTINLPPGISPYLIRPSMNHQIDTQLSDEMKRQLRDGKIVVLSDSVVRSNFEQNEEGKKGENEKDELKPENVNEKKNATETAN